MVAATSPARAISPAERSAKTTLLWGGVVLALGLALVGARSDAGALVSDEVGAVPVLAGLLLTILGIHTYGRLGPEDGAEPDPANPEARAAVWQGLLTAVAGAAVPLGAYYGGKAGGGTQLVAFAAILAGAGRAWMGVHALRGSKPAPKGRSRAKVEKRRRMDKSPAP